MPRRKLIVTIKEEDMQVAHERRSSRWNYFRTVSKFVSQLARYVLLVASCIYLFSSLILLLFALQTRTDLSYARLEHIDLSLSLMIGMCAYLMLVAAFGIYATFFSDRVAIKCFAALTTLNIVFGLFVIFYIMPKLDNLEHELLAKFKEYQTEFDWDSVSNKDEEVKTATWAWNSLQSKLHCCGLRQASDWAAFRPKEMNTTDALPRSCCQDEFDFDREWERSQEAIAATSPKPLINYIYCMPNTSKTWTHGCISALNMQVAFMTDMVLFTIIFSIKIGFLVGLILFCSPESARRSQRS